MLGNSGQPLTRREQTQTRPLDDGVGNSRSEDRRSHGTRLLNDKFVRQRAVRPWPARRRYGAGLNAYSKTGEPRRECSAKSASKYNVRRRRDCSPKVSWHSSSRNPLCLRGPKRPVSKFARLLVAVRPPYRVCDCLRSRRTASWPMMQPVTTSVKSNAVTRTRKATNSHSHPPMSSGAHLCF